MSKKIEITPGPELLFSLQRTGYKWHQAVLDIIDNSIDALRERYEATEKEDGFVRIKFISTKKRCAAIVIADNGTGISPESLEEILRMGTSFKRGRSALGTFGMGLKTAGMSLGNRITVISTTSDLSELRSVTWDISRAIRVGLFEADFHESPPKRHIEHFEKYVGDCSGTAVLIEDLREEGIPSSTGSMFGTMRKNCDHHYRHILNPDTNHLDAYFPVKILHGEGTANPSKNNNDPLLFNDERTEVLIGGQDGSFKEFDYDGFKFKARMVHCRLGQGTRVARGALGLGQYMPSLRAQGVYWIRGGREIYCGSFWSPTAHLANVYAEISFEDTGLGGKNGLIRMDFGKKGIVVNDDLKSWMLRGIFNPQLKKLSKAATAAVATRTKSSRKDLYEKVAAVQLPSDDFGRARRKISRRARAEANLFQPPDTKIKKAGKNAKYRGTSLRPGTHSVEFQFEEINWRGSNLPYDIEYTEGDPVAKILLNVDHEWIGENIIRNEDPPSCLKALQAIASITISHMHDESSDREVIFARQGRLLTIFDKDFGTFEGGKLEVEEVEKTEDELSGYPTVPEAIKSLYKKSKKQWSTGVAAV